VAVDRAQLPSKLKIINCLQRLLSASCPQSAAWCLLYLPVHVSNLVGVLLLL
jgi:hypothetical protein